MANNVTFNINAVDKTKGVFDKVNKGVKNFDRNTKRAGGSVSNMGYKAQQAGYQVQDLFVQIGGGQGVLRSLSQQAPQFLSIFGPGGAIVGAGVAIGAVVSQLVLAKNATDKAAESLKTYAEYAREVKKVLEDRQFERLSDFGKQDFLKSAIADKQNELNELHDTVSSFNALRVNKTGLGFLNDKIFKFLAGSDLEEAQKKIGLFETEIIALQDKLKGVNEEVDKKSADELQKINNSSESIAENLRKSVEAIVDNNLTPFERFEKKMIELRDLFRAAGSLFPREFFDREAARLRAVFEKDNAIANRPDVVRNKTDRFTRIGLLTDRGTSAEEVMRTESKKQTSLLEDIRDLLRRNGERTFRNYQMSSGIIT